jgi:hypothetical protein
MKFLLLALVAIAPMCAQNPATCNGSTPAICTGAQPSGNVQLKPQAVPTSTTAVTPADAYLQTVTVTNTTSGALTFTLADRQVSPVAVMTAVSIAANTTYVIAFPNLYWCPGGFTVAASGSGLNFYAAWKQ